MTEEEIIEIVEDYINYIRFKGNARYSINQWFMAIEDLLDLYNKEKEKNKNLLLQLKDSEKELLEVTKNIISKDKIKRKIKDLEELSNKIYTQPQIYPYIIKILKELLEDEEEELLEE